ncbi:chloride channel protein [Leptolyngbya sp. FACHB-261]|uniref:chloride channel protein n=1 Tax=Leptolyngbya sp. FACHB-261 TaxID=2692806 RepID=UPI00168A06AB|nr:chloride channel protein [Leptolyngbya sp. FACHB-261]MBD2103770.1 chloride channel protein [Leptolyngbya sp. FACHB-261]
MRTSPRLVALLNRLQPSAETVLLILAVMLGLTCGVAVVAFHWLIETSHRLLLEDLMGLIGPLGSWTLALVPVTGALLVAGLLTLHRRANNLLQIPLKLAAAAVSLGSGASLGPEGPSVELGASVGALFGQGLKFSQERVQVLLGAGSAAALAAGFNAPIAGVFLALEVVLRAPFTTSAASVVVLAAVVSALVAQVGLGSQPAFTLPAYEVRSLWELPLYLGLGVLASGVAVAYTCLVSWSRRVAKGEIAKLERFSRLPLPVRLVIGGSILGVVTLVLPQTLGIGYETIEALLQDVPLPLTALGALLIAKLMLSAVSLGTGFVGGIYAPSLFLGAVLGSAYAQILAITLPLSIPLAAPPAYAMVGMAAVLGASVRAPLTAVLLLFELTQDYRIVLPLMAAVGLSVWLTDRFKPRLPVQAAAAPTDEPPAADPLADYVVEAAMGPLPPALPGTAALAEAAELMTHLRYRSLLVQGNDEHLAGIVTLQDVERALSLADWHMLKVKDICTADVLSVFPDESLSVALKRMGSRGLHQLPVVSREEPSQVVGLLSREDILLTQSLALTRLALMRRIPVTLPESVLETVPESVPTPLIPVAGSTAASTAVAASETSVQQSVSLT